MVIIDKLNINDYELTETPELHRLFQKGACGLMLTNVASGYPRAANHTYATIGAGAKVSGGNMGGLALDSAENIGNERAGDLYYRNAGIAGKQENLVHLGLISAINDNIKLRQQDRPGSLGEAMGRHGIKAAVMGNADLPAEKDQTNRYGRQAVSIAMDNEGLVDYGDVGPSCYKKDIYALAGVSTNYNHLLNIFEKYQNEADFFVIETGDISRIEALRTMTPESEYNRHKKNALNNIDQFIGTLSRKLNLDSDLLMIISPDPSDDAIEKGNWLTPVFMVGKNFQRGVLSSRTTKQPGIITNTDIAPTILEHWDIMPQLKREGESTVTMAGQRVSYQDAKKPEKLIENLNNRAVFLHNTRYPFVKIFINGAFVLLILSFMLMRMNSHYSILTKPLWVGITTMPIVLFLAGRAFVRLNNYLSVSAACIILMGATCLVAIGIIRESKKYENKLVPFFISALLMAILIFSDIILGAPLGKTSPLSYDLMAGSRFYGIGNEYMGVFIGCALFIASILPDINRFRGNKEKIFLPVMFAAILIAIGSPVLGANLGGTIAAAAGFGTATVILLKNRVDFKHVLEIFFGACLVLITLFYFDSGRLQETQTHIGRTVNLVQAGGFSELFQIMIRKLAVNYKLIKYTTWSWFYFISLIIIIGGYKLFPTQHAEFTKRHPWFDKIKTGALTGSVFALLFNDSGVVAAATCILYTVAPYMYCLIEYDTLKERTSSE